MNHTRFGNPNTFKIARDATGVDCYNSTNACRITLPELDLFSRVVGVQNQQPFPVEFVSLQAKPQAAAVRVSWETANEQDVAYYQVERSTDGVAFTVLATGIKPLGGAGKTALYDHLDRNVLPNRRYFYRIRQVDHTALSAVSRVVEVMLYGQDAHDFSASLYPNPTSGALTLGVTLGSDQDVQVELYDMLGKRVVQRQFPVALGQSSLDLTDDIRALPAGAYTATIKTSFKVVTQKIIVAE